VEMFVSASSGRKTKALRNNPSLSHRPSTSARDLK
jgi:hypothetical protein